MNKSLVALLFMCYCFTCFAQSELLKWTFGASYNQQYPNGTYIKNYHVPNIEVGVGFRINRSHVFGLMPDVGLSTHNFGLTRNSDNYSKIYLRVAPYAGLKALVYFDKNKEGKLFQIGWVGSRLAFYNRFSPNAFFDAGISVCLWNHDFYLKWSTPLFYCFPDQNLWAKPVDMDNYFYPLGNERWSITAGVQFDFGKKRE